MAREQPVLGGYSSTDVDLDEKETPQGITLENEAVQLEENFGTSIKKVVNFLQKLFVLIDESFDEENGQPVFNGFKVIDIQVDDNDEVRNIVLQNEDGVKVTVHTGNRWTSVMLKNHQPTSGTGARSGTLSKKVICFAADLIRGNVALNSSTLDGEETVTFGDYSITDVQLDDNEQPQGIQLRKRYFGNKITFHIPILN
ncbi:hypothetical protein GPJ56_007895 [Histomonas meleagridis]|nr:hypothetical protein GPJ56_007895 [Histomonas meleagridis]